MPWQGGDPFHSGSRFDCSQVLATIQKHTSDERQDSMDEAGSACSFQPGSKDANVMSYDN